MDTARSRLALSYPQHLTAWLTFASLSALLLAALPAVAQPQNGPERPLASSAKTGSIKATVTKREAAPNKKRSPGDTGTASTGKALQASSLKAETARTSVRKAISVAEKNRLQSLERARRAEGGSERVVLPEGGISHETVAYARQHPVVLVLMLTLYGIVFLILVYTVRHYWFTVNRLVGNQRHPYIDIDEAAWPNVTVFIAAHNEEAVIDQILEALLDVDYPREKMRIVPVNDRSTDRTREIIDEWVVSHPGRIFPFHREKGKPGKAAALKDATELTDDDILIVFDADYIPGRGLIKQLVSPFFDAEVGAVMGRVVPWNVGANLLARLLDLERSGGYQVDQQARMNMKLVPQYGGTVGGVRKSALYSVGGWRDDTLSEDTDMTYNMLLSGWKTVYQNRSECYEEVPEAWPVRVRQIMRWAKGHNQAWARYSLPLLVNRNVSMRERIDGLLLLGVFVMSPLVMLGWILAMTLFYLGQNPLLGVVAVLATASYSALGNFAVFFEIASAARLDGYRRRIRLLPLNALGFLVSIVSVSRAGFQQVVPARGKQFQWDKTERFRKVPTANPVANTEAVTSSSANSESLSDTR